MKVLHFLSHPHTQEKHKNQHQKLFQEKKTKKWLLAFEAEPI